jgi:uncharacterized SAM-binding protein YcdF (DUF218 family)
MVAKLFTALISPLGTALFLGVLALALSLAARRARWAGWQRRGALVGGVALGWLWLWSMPIASQALRGWLEDQAGPRTLAAVQPAPVMVVLGGGIRGPRPPRRPDPDLGAAADRVWHAARLYRAGKAPRLIVSGGMARTGDGTEAAAMRQFLVDLGVPAAVITLEEASINTAGNARHLAEILAREESPAARREILLVTSALHMPRARRQFERAGFKVHPAPADFEVIAMPFDLLQVIPDAAALDGSARAFKELVGRWVGR